MSMETVRRAVDLFCLLAIEKQQKILFITFFGGEPLLNKELIYQAVDYADKNYSDRINLRYALGTNGTLLDDDFIGFIKRKNFIVHLSIDGHEAIHNKNRPSKDGESLFKNIVYSIEKLTGEGACAGESPATENSYNNLFAVTVITRDSLAHMPEMIDFILSKKIDNIILTVDFGDKWVVGLYRKLKRFYTVLLKRYIDLKKSGSPLSISLFDDKINLINAGSSYKKSCCNIGKENFVVNPDGDIFPCTRFANRSKGADYSIGNIFKGIVSEKIDVIDKARENDKVECKACEIRDICLGNSCSCISYSTTGMIDGVSPFICEHERMLVKLIKKFV